MVFTSYGAGPRPQMRFVDGGDNVCFGHFNGHYTFSHFYFIGLECYDSRKDPSSPDYESSNGKAIASDTTAWGEVDNGDDILVEDNYFHFTAGGIDAQLDTGPAPKNIRIRRNIATDIYSAHQTNPQGFFLANITNLLVEDNLFDHNAWNDQAGDPPSVFDHHMYVVDSYMTTIRNNLMLRDESLSLKLCSYAGQNDAFAGALVYNNLIFEGEVGISMGYGASAALTGSAFTGFKVDNNVLLQVDRDNPDKRGLGWGIDIQNVSESYFTNNIFSQFDTLPGGNTYAFDVDLANPNIVASGNTIQDNLIYQDAGEAIILDAGPTFSNIKIQNNTIQNTGLPTQSQVNYDPLMYLETDNSLAPYSFSGNTYYNAGPYNGSNSNNGFAFIDTGNILDTYDQWLTRSGETGSQIKQIAYPDPNRTLESYDVTLGGASSLNPIFAAIRSQSRASWNPAYTAEAINDYIRNGFSVALLGGGVDNSAAPPAPVTTLSATPGNNSVTLNWTAPGGGPTFYIVYRGTTAGAENVVSPVTTYVTGSSWTDNSAVNGTTYYYQVASMNAGGFGGLSNEVSAEPTVNAVLAAQTITFANPGPQTVGTPLTLSATATSGLAVSFASTTSGVCTVTGTTATFLTAGTCTIDATQAGNSTYAAAAMVSQSFTVNASGSGGDPTIGVLPSYNDVYANWKNAGLALVGGIPNRTTICATVNPLGGGQDDYNDIQTAINNCPPGEVVQLGAGAFSVYLADLPINISKGITLRGTGACSGTSSPYCQTSITVADGILPYQVTGFSPLCGTSSSTGTACPNGGPSEVEMTPVSPDYNYSWAQCGNIGSVVGTGCGAIPLAADAAQGQSTVQLTSTTGFNVGSWVLIDEASGAGWVADPMNQWTGYGSVWAAPDWLSPSGSPATGRVLWSKAEDISWDFDSGSYPYQANTAGCWWSYCDRPTAELHRIASIGAGPCPGTNCTITFDDPLTVAFRESGNHDAQVYANLYPNQEGTGSPIPFLQEAGVENLSLLRAPNGGIEMEFCVNCWIKNTEVGDWYGGGISIEYSARSELNTDYIHHCWDSVNSGGEYPINLGSASTEILLTNSIINFGGKGMVSRAGGGGSVVSYNYVDDTMYDANSGIGDYWVDMGINASHASGPHHFLFEGNWGDNLDGDNTHGNSVYITFFRNQGTGLRTPFTDPSIGSTALVDDFTGKAYYCPTGPANCVPNTPGPLRAAGPMTYNYWYAFVGNVLGLAGETTAANGWSYQGDWNGNRMFMLGWNTGNGGQDPYLDGVSGSYIFIDGNFDYVNNAVKWQGSPVTLPNSFYLASKPAFFTSSYPWPWVTPTGSQPIQTGPSGCGGTCSGLPAQARWQAGTPFAQP
jgi:hypothetical protein